MIQIDPVANESTTTIGNGDVATTQPIDATPVATNTTPAVVATQPIADDTTAAANYSDSVTVQPVDVSPIAANPVADDDTVTVQPPVNIILVTTAQDDNTAIAQPVDRLRISFEAKFE